VKIGTRHLPLNALQGFEAAGRHLNMRLAGEELNITQSGISHQVRSLERALGQHLFEPNRRRLVLTAEGRLLLETVRQALDAISARALQLGEDAYSASLSIAANPAFTSQWLIPRLHRFLNLFPDLSLNTMVLPAEKDGRLPKVDVAIVFNQMRFPGMRVETLVQLDMFPVCAPRLCAAAEVMDPKDLHNATLIHEDDGAIWARWFAAMGTDQISGRREIHVTSTQDALDLARAGIGFAINDRFIGWRYLAEGALVRPFGQRTFAFGAYVLVTQPLERLSPPAQAFTDWLRRETASNGQSAQR
jgi:LysR family transcriptional regulator, glycine cleavage system transcriptional activator